nr:MAG TPA: hypothetical protein [Caudoviricetes sp.]
MEKCVKTIDNCIKWVYNAIVNQIRVKPEGDKNEKKKIGTVESNILRIFAKGESKSQSIYH